MNLYCQHQGYFIFYQCSFITMYALDNKCIKERVRERDIVREYTYKWIVYKGDNIFIEYVYTSKKEGE